ncbi:hypothetical protein Pcinc_027186 [Petrolisthes cinctipes]|uniref:Uncharacterized protein n=1 Tax=Petrolisthes cinctipes TaxID=88211 RepID=A0AAE1F598_PETCI|nr:hypothetical protein Pcinc_027186 [Petrolisthes cinctipes]
MDVLGVRGIEPIDMVTMRGEGVVGSGVGSVGSGVVGSVVGNGGSGSDSSPTTTTTNPGGLQCSQDCHSNGTNGETQWKMLSQDSSKMNKIRDIVESSAR